MTTMIESRSPSTDCTASLNAFNSSSMVVRTGRFSILRSVKASTALAAAAWPQAMAAPAALRSEDAADAPAAAADAAAASASVALALATFFLTLFPSTSTAGAAGSASGAGAPSAAFLSDFFFSFFSSVAAPTSVLVSPAALSALVSPSALASPPSTLSDFSSAFFVDFFNFGAVASPAASADSAVSFTFFFKATGAVGSAVASLEGAAEATAASADPDSSPPVAFLVLDFKGLEGALESASA
mmetsp:Transcript_80640/g.216123  ORF Transcript_80640/g.216123 Transcript_80640/m.216123 type:complete len:243 (+) Transcript_80640:762-1490(+)